MIKFNSISVKNIASLEHFKNLILLSGSLGLTCLLVFQEDEAFLKTLFEQLTDDETDDSKRKDLIMFLKEFCTFSQTLQPANKCSFFKVDMICLDMSQSLPYYCLKIEPFVR